MIVDKENYNTECIADTDAAHCALCGAGSLVGSLRVKDSSSTSSKSSTNSLLSILAQVTGGGSISATDRVCSDCHISLNTLGDLGSKTRQCQDDLARRYRSTKRGLVSQQVHISPVHSALDVVKQLQSGTTIDVSPSLSVTVMREPMPKRRRYGIPEEVFLASSDPARRHCCDYSCLHIELPRTAPRAVTYNTTKDTPLKQSASPPYRNNYKSIKCLVGDLNKSHIASILKTPTRSYPKFNDLSNNYFYDILAGHNLPPSGLDYNNTNRINTGAAAAQHGLSSVVPCEGAGPVQLISSLRDSDDSSSDSDTSDDSSHSDGCRVVQQQPSNTDSGVSAATAMLLNNPVASSLLQSFLATSLWLQGGSGDLSPQQQPQHFLQQEAQGGDRDDNDDSDVSPEPCHDDVTCESLSVSVAVQDKSTRQELKNTGQSYINTKGKVVEAKSVAPQDCSKCVMRCSEKLSEGDRQKVFAEFWGLADYGKQREYLAQHMHREEKLGPSGLTRTVVLYYLTHNTKLQVCRQFFLKTLDVSEKASRIVLEKKMRGDFGVIGPPPPPPTHRTTSSRSRRMVAINQDSDYEY